MQTFTSPDTAQEALAEPASSSLIVLQSPPPMAASPERAAPAHLPGEQPASPPPRGHAIPLHPAPAVLPPPPPPRPGYAVLPGAFFAPAPTGFRAPHLFPPPRAPLPAPAVPPPPPPQDPQQGPRALPRPQGQ